MFSIFKINNDILLDTYISRIASGDMSALEKLYNETRVNVYAYAFSILKNTSDSEDVMQDVYLNIYKYAQSYSSRNKPLSWILTITKNLCVEKLRKKKKIIYDDIEKIENILGKKDISYDKVLLKIVLEELPDEERKLVILNLVEGFTFLEISKFLNMKLSTVLSKYNRAMKKVRKRYKEAINEK